jgi:hypothetical protein
VCFCRFCLVLFRFVLGWYVWFACDFLIFTVYQVPQVGPSSCRNFLVPLKARQKLP